MCLVINISWCGVNKSLERLLEKFHSLRLSRTVIPVQRAVFFAFELLLQHWILMALFHTILREINLHTLCQLGTSHGIFHHRYICTQIIPCGKPQLSIADALSGKEKCNCSDDCWYLAIGNAPITSCKSVMGSNPRNDNPRINHVISGVTHFAYCLRSVNVDFD